MATFEEIRGWTDRTKEVERAFASKQLTADAKLRLRKLIKILDELRRKKNVQNRQLQRWLTDNEYANFEKSWDEQRELRTNLEKKPEAIVEY